MTSPDPGLSPETEEQELDSLLFDTTHKECLGLLYKNLLDKSPKKLNSPSKKYMNISILDSVLKDFSGDYDSILDNLGTVRQAGEERREEEEDAVNYVTADVDHV